MNKDSNDRGANVCSNVFSMVDVTTVRWRRFLGPSNANSLGHDDPVLVSFASAVKRHLVCAWNFEDGSACLSSPVKRNLWVFWFDEEPALGDVIGPELQETEEGCWEKGMTMECMELLFLALRNVLERLMLECGFFRLGNQFVKGLQANQINSGHRLLLYSLSLFMHGPRMVCLAVDVHQCCTQLSTLHNAHIQLASALPSGLPVLLSPSGLPARLVAPGQASCEGSSCLHSDWKTFFPLPPLAADVPDLLPVTVDGVRMLYPSSLILVVVSDQESAAEPVPAGCPSHSAADAHTVLESHSLASQLLQGLHMDIVQSAVVAKSCNVDKDAVFSCDAIKRPASVSTSQLFHSRVAKRHCNIDISANQHMPVSVTPAPSNNISRPCSRLSSRQPSLSSPPSPMIGHGHDTRGVAAPFPCYPGFVPHHNTTSSSPVRSPPQDHDSIYTGVVCRQERSFWSSYHLLDASSLEEGGNLNGIVQASPATVSVPSVTTVAAPSNPSVSASQRAPIVQPTVLEQGAPGPLPPTPPDESGTDALSASRKGKKGFTHLDDIMTYSDFDPNTMFQSDGEDEDSADEGGFSETALPVTANFIPPNSSIDSTTPGSLVPPCELSSMYPTPPTVGSESTDTAAGEGDMWRCQPTSYAAAPPDSPPLFAPRNLPSEVLPVLKVEQRYEPSSLYVSGSSADAMAQTMCSVAGKSNAAYTSSVTSSRSQSSSSWPPSRLSLAPRAAQSNVQSPSFTPLQPPGISLSSPHHTSPSLELPNSLQFTLALQQLQQCEQLRQTCQLPSEARSLPWWSLTTQQQPNWQTSSTAPPEHEWQWQAMVSSTKEKHHWSVLRPHHVALAPTHNHTRQALMCVVENVSTLSSLLPVKPESQQDGDIRAQALHPSVISKELELFQAVALNRFQWSHADSGKLLSWRKLQHLSTSQEMTSLPVPALLVGYDSDWMSVSPCVLPYWESLQLQPVDAQHTVYYGVFLLEPLQVDMPSARHFFHELSSIFEDFQFGQHTPLPGFGNGDGMTTMDRSSCHGEVANFLSAAEATAKGTTSKQGLPLTVVLYVVVSQSAGLTKGAVNTETLQFLVQHLGRSSLTGSLKDQLVVQLVSTSQVMDMFHPSLYAGAGSGGLSSVKNMAVQVFSQCRHFLCDGEDCHAMTDFAASSSARSRLAGDHPDLTVARMAISSPYSLSTLKSTHVTGNRQHVLYCSYRWSGSTVCLCLMDKSGRQLHMATLHISCKPDKVLVRAALLSMLHVCLRFMAQTVMSWQLVISHLGQLDDIQLSVWEELLASSHLSQLENELWNDCGACKQLKKFRPRLQDVTLLSLFVPTARIWPATGVLGTWAELSVVDLMRSTAASCSSNADTAQSIEPVSSLTSLLQSPPTSPCLDDNVLEGFGLLSSSFNRVDEGKLSSRTGESKLCDWQHQPLAMAWLSSSTALGSCAAVLLLPLPLAIEQSASLLQSVLHLHTEQDAADQDASSSSLSHVSLLRCVMEDFYAQSWLSCSWSDASANCALPLHMQVVAQLCLAMQTQSLPLAD